MSRQVFGSCAYMHAGRSPDPIRVGKLTRRQAARQRQVALSQVWIGAKPCPIGSSSPAAAERRNLAWRRTGVVVGLPRHARAQLSALFGEKKQARKSTTCPVQAFKFQCAPREPVFSNAARPIYKKSRKQSKDHRCESGHQQAVQCRVSMRCTAWNCS